MSHYTPIERREQRDPCREINTAPLSRRDERMALKAPATRGYRSSQPLRQETRQRRSEPLLLWVYSFSAVCPDGTSFIHDVSYAVKKSADGAMDVGWRLCYETYPEADGYTFHNVQMIQVEPEHVALADGGRA